MNNETEYDLTDYSSQIEHENKESEKHLLHALSMDEDSRYHPLAQKSQPYDWCQALQYTN